MQITKQNIRDTMTKRRFTFIGSDSFALVFKSPKSREVVKFFKNDPGYLAFLQLVNKHPNKHFPQFRGYAPLPNWDGWHLVKLEPLLPIADYEFYSNYSWISYYCESLLFGPNIVPQNLRETVEQKAKSHQSLEQACMVLVAQRPSGYNLDIHEDNIMKRPDGTLVIIDPYIQG